MGRTGVTTLQVDVPVGRDAARHLDHAATDLGAATETLAGPIVATALGDVGRRVSDACREVGNRSQSTGHLLDLVLDRVEHADRLPPDIDRWIGRLAEDLQHSLPAAAPTHPPERQGVSGNAERSGNDVDEAFLAANGALGVTIPAGTDIEAVASILDLLQTRSEFYGHPANASYRIAVELFDAAVIRGDLVLNDEGWYEPRECAGQCWPSGSPASQAILGFDSQIEAEAVAEGTLDMHGGVSGVMTASIFAGIAKKIRPNADIDAPSRIVTTEPVTYGGTPLRTGTVWDDIVATGPVRSGTEIPTSFRLRLDDGTQVWVHPNSTKHMARRAVRPGVDGAITSQSLLRSLQAAIAKIDEQGVSLGKLYRLDGWELQFGIRPNDNLIVVNHALYRG